MYRGRTCAGWSKGYERSRVPSALIASTRAALNRRSFRYRAHTWFVESRVFSRGGEVRHATWVYRRFVNPKTSDFGSERRSLVRMRQ